MLRLRLLGPLALEHEDGRPVRSVLAQPRRFALLAYLAAVHPPASRRRDTILGLFWPEVEAERARTNLRQALYQLRRSLGPGVVTGKGSELVGVDPERLWCDAAAFSGALEEGRPEAALELCRGPFLEGFHLSGAPAFERWTEGERRRTRLEAARAAWELAERAEAAGDAPAVRRWGERALELTPYDEDALRRFLTVMARLDQPAAAVRAYETYVRRLAEDLELEPSGATRRLAERIRAGEGTGTSADGEGDDGGRESGRGDGDVDPGKGLASGTGTERTAPVPEAGVDRFGATAEGDDGGGAPEPGGSGPPRWRRPPRRPTAMLAAAVVLVIAGAVAAGLALREGPDSVAPASSGLGTAEDVVVVFPFRVTGEDEELGEGMVDLLAVKLAGTPRFRPVDPRTALSAWRRATRDGLPGGEDLVRAARSVGAGKLVDGSVVRNLSGVVLTASVLEVASGEATEALSVEGELEALPSLVDELAARLLALDAGEAERLASLTSPSLEAVRSWVRGRAGFREARYRAAAAHFEEAVRADSSFGLAGLGLREAAEWSTGPSQRQRELGERLAWAGRASLTIADRAMLDVLLGPRYPRPSTRADELEADRRALDLVPDSPEAWYEYGDDLYHRGELLGEERALGRAAEAFGRALALDSSFAAPLGHLIEVRTLEKDTASVRALTELYLSRHPGSELADFYRWRGATLLGDTLLLAELRARWETVPILSLWRILGYAVIDGRGLEDADRVASRLRRRPGPPAERTITRTMLHGYYLNRGRPGEALAVQRELGGPEDDREPPMPARPVPVELVHGALFWDGDRAAAEAVVGKLEEDGWAVPSDPGRRARRMGDLCLAAQWWAGAGDSPADVERAVRLLRGSSYPRAQIPDRNRDRRCATLLRVMAAGALPPAEVEERVDRLDSLSRTVPSEEFSVRANLASVRALAAIGREERALSIASRRLPNWNAEYGAPRYRWRARLAAELGRPERAAEAAAVYRALRDARPGTDGRRATSGIHRSSTSTATRFEDPRIPE